MRWINPIKHLTILLPVLLAGCAVVSEEECRAGQWYERGVSDGARGRSQTLVYDIAQTCQEYGVRVDSDAWLRGHEQGVEQFCTPENGYRYGRQGRSYQGVCTGPTADLFLDYYRQGLADYQVEREYRRLAARQDHVERQLFAVNAALAGAEDPKRIRRLQMRRLSLNRERQLLDMEMFRIGGFGFGRGFGFDSGFGVGSGIDFLFWPGFY